MPSGPSSADNPSGNRTGDLNRETFYDQPENDSQAGGDDDEYELEPIDPAILENQRKLAQAEVTRAEMTLDIDRLDAESNESTSLDDFATNFKFQFQTKHLLMATAGLAVILSLGKLMGSNLAALFVIFLALLIAAHTYLGWQERKRAEQLREKRRRLVEMARARKDGEDPDRAEIASMYDELEDEEEELAGPKRKPIRLAFSMKELMIAVTVSAVALGLVGWLGGLLGINLLAGVLGLLALVGLIVFAIGIELPAAVMLGWWVILVLYIGVSFFGSFVGSSGAS